MSPFFVPMIIPNLAPGQIAIRFGAKGPNLCFSTACSASTHSVGHAFRMIRDGEVDVVIAGGAEAAVTRLGSAPFPPCEPFHGGIMIRRPRAALLKEIVTGFVMGEGAGVLILEEHGQAVKGVHVSTARSSATAGTGMPTTLPLRPRRGRGPRPGADARSRLKDARTAARGRGIRERPLGNRDHLQRPRGDPAVKKVFGPMRGACSSVRPSR